MRVFYLTGPTYGINNLALKRLKVSRFRDLNDPFELLGANLADPGHRHALRATKEHLDAQKGLICFTRSWSNPLMWGHYADKHTGIAIGFDVPDAYLCPVIYAKRLERIKLDPITKRPSLDLVDRLIRTKFWDWRYEEECRMFVNLDPADQEAGLHFVPFSENLVLRQVVLGPKCALPLSKIRELVADQGSAVTVVKARIAFTSFKVLEDSKVSRLDGIE